MVEPIFVTVAVTLPSVKPFRPISSALKMFFASVTPAGIGPSTGMAAAAAERSGSLAHRADACGVGGGEQLRADARGAAVVDRGADHPDNRDEREREHRGDAAPAVVQQTMEQHGAHSDRENFTQFAAKALRFRCVRSGHSDASGLQFANHVASAGYFDSRAPDRLAAIEVNTALSSLATCTS